MSEFTLDIDTYAEGAIILDGFDDCIIGIVEEFGNGKRILYDKTKMLEKLTKENLMTQSEAEEYFDYNILGLYAGEQNPVFLDLSVSPVLKDDGNYSLLINAS
jgi:hypothetical protein